MNEPIINSNACRFESCEERIVVTLHRRNLTIGLSYVLLVLGFFPSLIGVVLFVSNKANLFESMSMPIAGLPFILLAMFVLSNLLRHWGTVVIDKSTGTITWNQGELEIGCWQTTQVSKIRTDISLLLGSFRTRFARESILWMEFENGQRLRIAIGYPDEQERTRAELSELGLPG